MPEQFGFACFLERSATGDPRPIIDATAILFCEHLGSAIELSVLDYKIGTQVRKPWCHADQLVQTWPAPTQILFVYFGDPEKRRGCISLSGTTVAAELTVAMENMTLASRTDDVADLCMGLYAVCRSFAAECLVAAGGEIEFSTEPRTVTQALEEVTAPLSLAQWIAHRNQVSIPIPPRFVEVRRSRTTVLLRAS